MDGLMSVADYFGMIILILMGLTFIALFLAFLYMIYGEKEEGTSSTNVRPLHKIRKNLLLSFRFLAAP